MKNAFYFVMCYSLVQIHLFAQIPFGDAELINNSWKFVLEEHTVSDGSPSDASHWIAVDLPHDWSILEQHDENLASCTGYLPGGVGWYEKELNIPSQPLNDRVYLYFEGVYNRSEVYLNGNLLGKRPNGYISFIYDATPYVLFDDLNVITVRVDHSMSADSRWYTGSGIYRNVWLIRSSAIHFSEWGVFSRTVSLTNDKAEIQIDAKVVNDSPDVADLEVKHTIMGENGEVLNEASGSCKISPKSEGNTSTSIPIESPELWSIENPHLYKVITQLLANGNVVDQSIVHTGIREFSFDPDKGLRLNGKNIKVKGVCIHHDAGVLGSAVPKEVWRSRLMTLKSLGCNAIRMSHNPQAPDVYDLCDELGFLVLNEAFDEWEFPKRKWLKGWNVGEPGFQGSYDFFEEWSSRDLADMVKRDRNHPSIFAWSIGNEVDYPNDPYSHPVLDGNEISQPMYGGYKPENPDANRLGAIAHRLSEVVKKYDPSRPVTAALAGVVMSNETEYPSVLDIAGYNYTENRYSIDHKKYTDRVIYGSENRHDLDAWKMVVDNEFIFGQFLWTGIDYLGEAGPWPSRGARSGLLNLGGLVKPRGYYRKTLWSDEPSIYLGTYPKPEREVFSIDALPTWNYEEGDLIRVVCYTIADQVRLYINGKLSEMNASFDEKTGIYYWDVPFSPGFLRVDGMDASGKTVSSFEINTSGRPDRLMIRSSTNKLDRESDVAIVTVQMVDGKGNPVLNNNKALTCLIEGPGRLLGLEASNQRDVSDYTDNIHDTFLGQMVAYIKSTGEKGEIVVRFTGEGIESADLHLSVP